MEINGNSTNSTVPNVISPDQTGFNSLTAESFMKLLITELQNQDPTQPVGNEELLNQFSMMRNLQSNIELSDTLKAISVGQQLSTAASFIGKSVSGTDRDGEYVTGVVDRAFLDAGQVFMGVGGAKIPVDQITEVHLMQSEAA